MTKNELLFILPILIDGLTDELQDLHELLSATKDCLVIVLLVFQADPHLNYLTPQ